MAYNEGVEAHFLMCHGFQMRKNQEANTANCKKLEDTKVRMPVYYKKIFKHVIAANGHRTKCILWTYWMFINDAIQINRLKG